MRVLISDQTTGLGFTFYEATDFDSVFGYDARLVAGYDKTVTENNAFLLLGHSGFFGNLIQNPSSKVGISQKGETFGGSRLSARTIVMNFQNALAPNMDGTSTVLNELNFLLEIIDRPLRVDVFGSDKVFTNYFYVRSETDTESGIIQLTSANTGQGVYWSAGAIEIKKRFFASGINYVAKDFPAPLLGGLNYPLELDYRANGASKPVIQFGCSKERGTWNSVTFELNGITVHYDNANNDAYITVDTDAQTCVNGNGINRISNLTLSNWPEISAGNNNLVAFVNGSIVWQVAEKYLGQDMFFSISFERLTSGVE